MLIERQSQALFRWYGCFVVLFCFRPLSSGCYYNIPLLVQKNHFVQAGTGHLCTDQARHHEMVAAAPTTRPIGRTEEKGSGRPVGDLIRGELLVWVISYLNFSIGNYTEDQWGEEKGIPGGYHPVWRKQGFLDFFVILCLAVSDRMPTWSCKQIDNA